jgi:hypothetical protein
MGTLGKVFGSEVETMAAQAEAQLGEEVLAAGRLRQGKRPSMAAMVTGTALFEVLRPRRSKTVPRSFVLALTPTRVVAFGFVGVSDDDDGTNYRAVLREGERGSWPREAVSLSAPSGHDGLDRTLRIGGEEILVTRPSNVDDPETDAFETLLAGAVAA